jgi:hypothetical protein
VITAERFATSSGTYWSSVLPRLDHFVRLTNLGPRRAFPPIRVDFPSARQALVSETGFMLWALRRRGDRGTPEFEGALSAARARLSELQVQDGLTGQLMPEEIQAVEELARRLTIYVSSPPTRLEAIEIEPRLAGCGVVTGGVPDLLGTLADRPGGPLAIVEFKAVDRTFRSTDFRQLVAYTALYFAEHRRIPEVLALANILRGTTLEVGTEEFFDDVAGASADEVVQRLVADWSGAGVSL